MWRRPAIVQVVHNMTCHKLRCPAHVHRNSGHTRIVCSFPYTQSENASPGTRIAVLRPPPCGSLAALSDTPSQGTPAGDDAAPPALHLQGMRWGLVPSFTKRDSKPDFWRMFNARSEGVASRSIFSRLLKHPGQRCVVVVEGFYEWKSEHKRKQPYYIHRAGGAPLLFAGLHDSWKDGEEEGVDMPTVTILTTESSERIAWLHNRMPVVLPDAEACRRWLSAPVDELETLYTPYDGADIVWHAVTPAMSKASYKEADCAVPLKVATVTSFFSASPGKGKGGASKASPAGRAKSEDAANAGPTNADDHKGPTKQQENAAAKEGARSVSEGGEAGTSGGEALKSESDCKEDVHGAVEPTTGANKRSRDRDAGAAQQSPGKKAKDDKAVGSKSLLAFYDKT